MFLGCSCLMMCPETIPSSEWDQKSQNECIKKKSGQLHIVYLKSENPKDPVSL